jgi:hypothetical protein
MNSNGSGSKKPQAVQGLWSIALGALLGAVLTTALFTQQGEYGVHMGPAGKLPGIAELVLV